jgi:aminoglycoside phosphotransferase (APT) family kinase protein
LREAEQAGVTVPHAHWLGSADDGLGVPFMVMDFVPGLALGQRLLRDDAYASTREALPAQLAGELARLHAAAPGHRLPGATPAGDDPRRFALAAVKQWTAAAATLHTDYPRPALDLAARWLELNAPSVQEPVLVHGDFRIGNIMFDERGLTAVLDWELAHLGDPAEDLGWLCVRSWRFGRDHPAVGGLCTRSSLLELYREAGGRAVSADQLRYWEIFGNWKWAIICLLQAASARAGSSPDVELAAIGRRVPAVEWELVDLLDREKSQ